MTTSGLTYNTAIAVEGLRITHEGPRYKTENSTFCAMCGRPLPEGNPCEKLALGKDSFMDDGWFATRSGVVCQDCGVMMTVPKVLASNNCIVYTRDGVYPISKDPHRTWFLLTPPEGPFVATASATMNFQHVVWKTPVTYSKELIYVGWPTRIMTIRHSVLMKAVKICEEISPIVEQIVSDLPVDTKSKKKKKPFKQFSHPYITLDRNLGDLNHGVLRPDILSYAEKSQDLGDRLAFLQGLSIGETWALATLSKAKKEEPVKPEPLTNTKQKEKSDV